MAINLATKYAEKLAMIYTANSPLEGNVSIEFNFDGVRGIEILTPITVALNQYKRSGSNRYGDPQEMGDSKQSLYMDEKDDLSFTYSIDKGNRSEQLMLKEAARTLSAQIGEQVVPKIVQNAFKKWSLGAGKIVEITEPTTETIVSQLLDIEVWFDDTSVPNEDRVVYIPPKYKKAIMLSDQFIKNDNLGTEVIKKGVIGNLCSLKIVVTPSKHFPTDLYFLATQKKSVLAPQKLADGKIHMDAPGYSGALVEGRYYNGAFVIGTFADGVYAAVKTGTRTANAAISITSNQATITSATSGAVIYYTTDGSNPRYSSSKIVYGGAAVTIAAGATVRAFAVKDGMYPSDVTATINL